MKSTENSFNTSTTEMVITAAHHGPTSSLLWNSRISPRPLWCTRTTFTHLKNSARSKLKLMTYSGSTCKCTTMESPSPVCTLLTALKVNKDLTQLSSSKMNLKAEKLWSTLRLTTFTDPLTVDVGMVFILLWLPLVEAVQLTWLFQLSKLLLKPKKRKTNRSNPPLLTNTVPSLSQVSAVELPKEKMFLFLQAVILTPTICARSELSSNQMKKNCAVKWPISMSINNVKLLTPDAYWKAVCKPKCRKIDSRRNWQLSKPLKQLKKDLLKSSVDLFRLKVMLSQLEYIFNQR